MYPTLLELPGLALFTGIYVLMAFRFSFPGVQKPLDQCGSTCGKKATPDDDNFDLFGSEDEEV